MLVCMRKKYWSNKADRSVGNSREQWQPGHQTKRTEMDNRRVDIKMGLPARSSTSSKWSIFNFCGVLKIGSGCDGFPSDSNKVGYIMPVKSRLKINGSS
jgi:hypothetical protein